MVAQEADRGGARVLVVQHQEDCGPAWFGTWLTQAGCDLGVVRPWLGEPLPDDLTGYDGLLVLGGSMGAGDDAEDDAGPDAGPHDPAPWLAPVKALVRVAVDARVPTLGICLGHQLVAAALGGRVARSPRGQSVGLIEVGWTAEAGEDPLTAGLATGRRGIHWNDDVVTVEPPGTVALARTPGGELQVARFAPAAWGVQLHPEADREVVGSWAAGDAERHAAAGLDQPAVLADIDAAGDELRAAWEPLARSFAGLCADADTTRGQGAG